MDARMPHHRRKTLRLPTFDYTDPGPYFVTLCLNEREPRFGHVDEGVLVFNSAGEAVHDLWLSIPRRFPSVLLDAFVVMPDHLHGILTLHEGGAESTTVPLGAVIRAFKSESTTTYINGVKKQGWPPFAGKLWQSNYYEHIIRDERDLATKQAYIEGNPARWQDKRS